MAKNNKPQKPTNKDFFNAINALIRDVHLLKSDMDAIMGAFDMYVEYKDDNDGLKAFIDKKININKEKDNELQATGQDNTVANKTNSSD
jgi:hypothetical protein